MTALVACSHGTRSPVGRAAVASLVSAVRAASSAPVLDAFVDVHGPYVADVVASVSGGAVVVPLLLAPGYHVRVDIARAAAPWSSAVRPPSARRRCSRRLLMDRLRAAGARPGDAVVLGRGRVVRRRVRRVGACRRPLPVAVAWGAPVSVAYGASRLAVPRRGGRPSPVGHVGAGRGRVVPPGHRALPPPHPRRRRRSGDRATARRGLRTHGWSSSCWSGSSPPARRVGRRRTG